MIVDFMKWITDSCGHINLWQSHFPRLSPVSQLVWSQRRTWERGYHSWVELQCVLCRWQFNVRGQQSRSPKSMRASIQLHGSCYTLVITSKLPFVPHSDHNQLHILPLFSSTHTHTCSSHLFCIPHPLQHWQVTTQRIPLCITCRANVYPFVALIFLVPPAC